MNTYPPLADPVRVALIGTGNRSWKIYRPLFESLKPWIRITAVCDPVVEHGHAMGESLGVPAYDDIHRLAADGIAEAAVVVTPIESHHAMSVFLSSHGMHNLIETTWCSTIIQAKDMIEQARRNRVVTRVAENFFRFPIDRFAQTLRDDGMIGKISRIVSYDDHTGYHNNSRWIAFFKEHPRNVQSIVHSMKTKEFYSTPERRSVDESYRLLSFEFPSGGAVIDHSANIKGFLGRQVRPGHTEWHGDRGALVQQSFDSTAADARRFKADGSVEAIIGKHSDWKAEIRMCSKTYDPAAPDYSVGYADLVCDVERSYDEGRRWTSVYANTPSGRLEYVNQLRPTELSDNYYPEYGSCVMGHLVDFALAVRGKAPGEFDEKDALMSLMMEMGANESALHGSAKVALPIMEDLEADALMIEKIKKQYGVDPLDVEAMLAISYPKP